MALFFNILRYRQNQILLQNQLSIPYLDIRNLEINVGGMQEAVFPLAQMLEETFLFRSHLDE